MPPSEFQRARSAEAKQVREDAILDAARALGAERGVRTITLTDVAEAVGMHKSALLRYFETREQIFLMLTAEGWRDWSVRLQQGLAALERPSVEQVAALLAETLLERPLFCDLLAQAPLNLERNVSIEAVRAFKTIALGEVHAIGDALAAALGLTERQGLDTVATATSMAGALWQMATPGPDVQALFRREPQFAHALVEVTPQLSRILVAMLTGFRAGNGLDGKTGQA
ncbi:TetR family transcriptional regulator [Devosia sp. 2618]|uniref:TetR/AcrR family transcriptional regulator n=1 Tax=Devosia sp. 2618 TaxID=3156454 RepID=UPI00339935A3